VDAKIDAYIKENPKYWAYIQGMPRERLERTLVLNEVRELDRQHRMKEGILKQINKSPALKAAYDTLVKDLPEEQREGVIAQLARQAKRAVARSQNQQQTAKEAVGV
jgi:predicted GTPase